MKTQNVFKRVEIKYLLNEDQYNYIKGLITKYCTLDEYGVSHIRNIYYDTDNYEIIRKSNEKPFYKEKLRVRSYEETQDDTSVFLEMKNKCNNIVYKRRVKMIYKDVKELLTLNTEPTNQIMREITSFRKRYNSLKPAMFLYYDRLAYSTIEKSDLRITFDYNIIYRNYNLDLSEGIYGEKLLNDNEYLLEIKTGTAIPLWLVKGLSEKKIYKHSFSKYGTAYYKIQDCNIEKHNIQKEKTKYGTAI